MPIHVIIVDRVNINIIHVVITHIEGTQVSVPFTKPNAKNAY